PLPHAKIPSEYLDPKLAKEYPLILITGLRVEPFFASEGRQIWSLRKINPDPLVEINPLTAKELGIKDGDWVWIETQKGKIKQKTHLTDRIHPKIVGAQYGWWFPEKEPPEYGFRDSNVNILLGNGPYDPHTGGEPLRGVLCKIYKV
ncbi:MAG: molybdopterin dinucleotide binding domain-containing protein, partial [Candidatus Bathyarchaeia archaeon]